MGKIKKKKKSYSNIIIKECSSYRGPYSKTPGKTVNRDRRTHKKGYSLSS